MAWQLSQSAMSGPISDRAKVDRSKFRNQLDCAVKPSSGSSCIVMAADGVGVILAQAFKVRLPQCAAAHIDGFIRGDSIRQGLI